MDASIRKQDCRSDTGSGSHDECQLPLPTSAYPVPPASSQRVAVSFSRETNSNSGIGSTSGLSSLRAPGVSRLSDGWSGGDGEELVYSNLFRLPDATHSSIRDSMSTSGRSGVTARAAEWKRRIQERGREAQAEKDGAPFSDQGTSIRSVDGSGTSSISPPASQSNLSTRSPVSACGGGATISAGSTPSEGTARLSNAQDTISAAAADSRDSIYSGKRDFVPRTTAGRGPVRRENASDESVLALAQELFKNDSGSSNGDERSGSGVRRRISSLAGRIGAANGGECGYPPSRLRSESNRESLDLDGSVGEDGEQSTRVLQLLITTPRTCSMSAIASPKSRREGASAHSRGSVVEGAGGSGQEVSPASSASSRGQHQSASGADGGRTTTEAAKVSAPPAGSSVLQQMIVRARESTASPFSPEWSNPTASLMPTRAGENRGARSRPQGTLSDHGDTSTSKINVSAEGENSSLISGAGDAVSHVANAAKTAVQKAAKAATEVASSVGAMSSGVRDAERGDEESESIGRRDVDTISCEAGV